MRGDREIKKEEMRGDPAIDVVLSVLDLLISTNLSISPHLVISTYLPISS